MFTSTLTPLTFGSPQCQEATHPILPTQPFLQQSLHQRVVVEQPLHPQPQPQPQPQLLLLQELQPQFLLDFYIWEPQSQPESRFIGQTWQKQTLDFPECIGRLEQPEETSQQGLVQSAHWPHDVFFYWLSWIFTADNNSIPLVSQRTPLCLSEGINTVMKCKRWCVHGHTRSDWEGRETFELSVSKRRVYCSDLSSDSEQTACQLKCQINLSSDQVGNNWNVSQRNAIEAESSPRHQMSLTNRGK